MLNAIDARLIEQVKKKQVRIAVIGMGHVGLPTALGFASMGWTVLGVDSSESLVSMIQAGKVPFYEPGLDDLLKRQLGKKFLPVSDMDQAIREATILFLCVGTPQKENGQADLSQVEAAARSIAHNLNGYKLIVEKSTVPAITAQWICRTIRRFATNGRAKLDFDVASNPEFLQEGVALKNISRPERIVCGVESERARRIVEEMYRPPGTAFDYGNQYGGDHQACCEFFLVHEDLIHQHGGGPMRRDWRGRFPGGRGNWSRPADWAWILAGGHWIRRVLLSQGLEGVYLSRGRVRNRFLATQAGRSCQ